MKKPNNWENTAAYGDFEQLELGGHICRICKVEETISKGGRDMASIWLDIAEGDQAGYYTNRWRNDPGADKKWPCIFYQLQYDEEGNTNRGYKTFIEAVKKSNPDFNESRLWDADGCDYLKGKLVGGVFGREQYLNRDGEPRFAVKCMYFRDVDTIRKGVKVPEDRLLPEHMLPRTAGPSEFTEVETDNDLPF